MLKRYIAFAFDAFDATGGWNDALRDDPDDAVPRSFDTLEAAIEALRALKRRAVVDLYTDSQYLRQGMQEWLPRWKQNGWRTADRRPVKNADLWRELDRLCSLHDVRWHWLRGHAGHPENERSDRLARAEISKHVQAR